MSLKRYLLIASPTTALFIYGLYTNDIPVVVLSGISALVLSNWMNERGSKDA